jgi:hypothetical protein
LKNQYFGDINDYAKFAILRAVTLGGRSLAVCWLLTPDDARGDGRFTRYLGQPRRFRRFDPNLFDVLARAVSSGCREVGVVEDARLLGDTTFYGPLVPEAPAARQAYFDELWRLSQGRRVIFFDPDNGLEVPSVPYGRRGARRYLYWHELEAGWLGGFSLIVYQHYRRVPRIPFVDGLLDEIEKRLGATPFVLMTARVAFFVVPQAADAQVLEAVGQTLAARWDGIIRFHPSEARN